MIEWDKDFCCESCGAKDFFTMSIVRDDRRRRTELRLCRDCMQEMAQKIETDLKKAGLWYE